MATSFNSLINRVELATIKLEDSVDIVQDAGQQVGDSVAQAAAYALDAETASVQAAINTGLSLQYANEAEDYRDETQSIVDQFSQENVIGEAPINGSQYARQDGSWALLETGGGGGTVVSVNNVEPDSLGNVTLPIPEQENSDWEATEGVSAILNKPTLFDGDYNSLTNKPSIPESVSELTNDSGYIEDAPIDTNQYVRKDGDWTILEETSGGGDTPFLTGASSGVKYGSIDFERWVDNNPYTQAELGQVNTYIMGRSVQGFEFFNSSANAEYLPDGAYSYVTSDVTGTDLLGTKGVIHKGKETYAINNEGLYTFSGGSWTKQGGSDEPTPHPVTSSGVRYDGSIWRNWVSTNPFTPAEVSKLSGVVMGRAATGFELFNNAASISALPDGVYSFNNGNNSSMFGALNLQKGVIYVHGDYCWARATRTNMADRHNSYTFKPSTAASTKGTWVLDYIPPIE